MSTNDQASKEEVLLAIAMSSFYRTTHVKYMPAGKVYINTLQTLRTLKYIKPMGSSFYKLTTKGLNHIKRQDTQTVTDMDAQIDLFVDNL